MDQRMMVLPYEGAKLFALDAEGNPTSEPIELKEVSFDPPPIAIEPGERFIPVHRGFFQSVVVDLIQVTPEFVNTMLGTPGARDNVDRRLMEARNLLVRGTAAFGAMAGRNLVEGHPYRPATERERRFAEASLATRGMALRHVGEDVYLAETV